MSRKKKIAPAVKNNYALFITLFITFLFAIKFSNYLGSDFNFKTSNKIQPIKLAFEKPIFYSINFPVFYLDQNYDKQIELEKELRLKTKEKTSKYNQKKRQEWTFYNNKWFGFSLRYPNHWLKPQKKAPTQGQSFEALYQFRKPINDNNSRLIGYDILIYRQNSKISDLMDTQEIQKKNFESKIKICEDFLSLNDSWSTTYPRFLIEVEQEDPCYEKTHFVSYQKNKHIYNIIPVTADNEVLTKETEINEYALLTSNINLTQIIRPKPKPKAPIPHGAKKVNGKYVCAKKNDKPSVSSQNKKGHMDMQCCLDPDETPNPWCTY
ncbi:MAG: hypothetical protein GF347_04835 [Candidatus Moranbacteria bacterium]|nr:hypothetical protein [Candidatus Moranbacteria bacterium]